MSSAVYILLATAALALVALVAAFISVRNVRMVRRALDEQANAQAQASAAETAPTSQDFDLAGNDNSGASTDLVRLDEPDTSETSVMRVIDGRVVVTPTRQQVAAAVMGQPRVRVMVWLTGLGHALRPESRDRIVGMIRRDYRERRRHRDKAARRAARAAHSPAAGVQDWVGP